MDNDDIYTITTSGSSDFSTITLDNNTMWNNNYTIVDNTTTSVPYTWKTNGTNTFTDYGNAILNSGTSTNVHISGDGITMESGADIKIGGKSLMEAIEKIEERLAILKPNSELEDRWEQLKELGKQYKELEAEILEKEKIMKILKDK